VTTMHRLLAATSLTLASFGALAASDPTGFKPHDEFYWLEEMNKASSVMVAEQGIVSNELSHVIANSIAKSIELGDQPQAPRPDVTHYLTLEQQLISIGGPDVTRVHSGRSRQDLIATVDRLKLRERLLQWMTQLIVVRSKLAELASHNIDTIIPAYTNGVQAQPITLAHYLLAYDQALARDADRTREAYVRLNLSPLGSAALGTSSFPINRPRLAELLGFDGVAENSYDANEISALDVPLESLQIAESSALTIGSLIEEIELQYHETNPWLLLREGALTGPSSIMPQKRNPYGLLTVREDASEVLGTATTFEFIAHNLPNGMPDYKHGKVEASIDTALKMLNDLSALIDALVVNPERALDEVNSDYSTTTELADELQQRSNVPFRIGHQFASQLVTFGRAHHLRPIDLSYADAQRIYTESAATFGMQDATLPLSEQQFRNALSAKNMVDSAIVMGGPQPAEVTRMLSDTRAAIARDQSWLEARQQHLADGSSKLDAAFERQRSAH
jgi:argininosuccinate lyase